ncbi:two-partner secretion domain-containing protein [Thiomicrospira cyclica]|uniref:Filamentous hemagglutinin family outer membrane protein n=1 Tax=Thiomicrospira cyclica (strain DSM 14477 / JCM 11371 / ALM1) TaxID=717773 RepID=F6D8Y2_THICA|nr:YDG domain-containing protein [Thiomicrospira cyclica]AEG31982.1 filamentous hemagglutinin family outer membrane protein [Thiomicrospira cyclica ALM1]
MNKAYKLVWSAVNRTWVAVSEVIKTAQKGRGKVRRATDNCPAEPHGDLAGLLAPPLAIKPLAFSLLVAMTPVSTAYALDANALPTGGQVSAGQADISQTHNALVVQQHSHKLITNWNSFNIGRDASVTFQQPTGGHALARISDNNPSQILGQLSANANLTLVNPSGIIFGAGAQVNVGSLVATTLNITDQDFLNGQYRFDGQGALGQILNEGQLEAFEGGRIVLMANQVTNQGQITAPNGDVALIAANKVTLDFNGDGSLLVEIEQGTLNALVENQNAIQVGGGQILLSARALDQLSKSVVNNTGLLEANSLTEQGGRIILEGDDITLTASSSLIATGKTGGGDILVGGDWQGGANEERRVFEDPNALYQATTVTMEQGATIDASATVNGKGGTVVLWSDISNAESVTAVSGSLYAKGGANGGDGGQIETSGHQLSIADSATVSTHAPQGKSGEWLLDPRDIRIASDGDVSGEAIGTALANNNVTITTEPSCVDVTCTFNSEGEAGNIEIVDAITFEGANTLTLEAAGSISGSGNINFGTHSGAQLVLNTASGTGTYSGVISGSGSLVKAGAGALTLTGNSSFTEGIRVDGGELIVSGTLANNASNDVVVNEGGTFVFGRGDLFATNSSSRNNTITINEGGVVTNNGNFNNRIDSLVLNGGTLTSIGGSTNPSGGQHAGAWQLSDEVTVNANSTITGVGLVALGAGSASPSFNVSEGAELKIDAVLRNGVGNPIWPTAFAGNLVKNGAGTLVLTQNNVYTGTNTINAGTLQIGDGSATAESGSLGTAAISIAADASLIYARSDNLTLNQAISGAGGLIKENTGELTLSSTNNTFTGGMIVNGGSLIVEGRGSGNPVLANHENNNIVVNDGGTFVFGGTGGDVFGGNSVARQNTITINAGGVVTNSGNVNNRIGKLVLNGGTLTSLGGTTNTSGGVSAGAWQLSDEVTVNANSTISGVGLVALGAANASPTFNVNEGTELTIDAVLRNGVGTPNFGNAFAGNLVIDNTGTVFLTRNNTYTGNNTINAGTLVLRNDNPDPSSKSFTGAGLLRIESDDDSFTSAFNTNGWTFGSALTGLTLGKESNTANITIGSAASIAGSISVYGGDITVNQNLTSTANGAEILLKASGRISTASDRYIRANNGDIIFWANSNGSESGGITIGANSWLNSANGLQNQSSGGGNIILAGGSEIDGDGNPTGFAKSNTTHGVFLGNDTRMYSGGGDVAIRGKSTNTSSSPSAGSRDGNGYAAQGIRQERKLRIESGTGQISLVGESDGYYGIELAAMATSNDELIIRSAAENGDAISIHGEGHNSYGVMLNHTQTPEPRKWIVATGAEGNITITGRTSHGTYIGERGSGSDGTFGIFANTRSHILASSGIITLDGGTEGIRFRANSELGARDASGSLLSTSESNLVLTADKMIIDGTIRVESTGTLTVQPYSTSFSEDLDWPLTNLNIVNSISGLTLGKPGNSANITINSAQTIAGPISVYGGDITVNQNLTSTANGAEILLKASGNISTASNRTILANNGDIIFWANSNGSESGGITIGANSWLNSANGSQNQSSGGGNIVLAGGSEVDEHGDPTGFAQSNTTHGVFLSDRVGIWSGGGDVVIRGKSTTAASPVAGTRNTSGYDAQGVRLRYDLTINSGVGTIAVIGESSAYYGIELNANGGSSRTTTIRSDAPTGQAILMDGLGHNSYGIKFNHAGNKWILGAGGGDVTLRGHTTGTVYLGEQTTFGGLRGMFFGDQSRLLASGGTLILDGGSHGLHFRPDINVGARSDSGGQIQSSTSNVMLVGDVIPRFDGTLDVRTTGALTIQPSSTSFTSELNWRDSFTHLRVYEITGLVLGKEGNTANITINRAETIAGPISVYGGDITVNQNLISTANGADILLIASGNITLANSRSITTNNGDIIFWSDSDASGSGGISLGSGINLNSVNGATTSGLSGGGKIVLAGGNDSDEDGVPDGYAVSASAPGVRIQNNAQIRSGGGDIIIRGKSTNPTSGWDAVGLRQEGTLVMDSGTGTIELAGQSDKAYGVELQAGSGAWIDPNSGTLSIQSAATSGTAISLTGSGFGSYGVLLNYGNAKTIEATGGGDIVIIGSTTSDEYVGEYTSDPTFGTNVSPWGVFFGDHTSLLASGGKISVDGGTEGVRTRTNITLGEKSGSAVTASTANIQLLGDKVQIDGSSGTSIATTGTLTLAPSSNSFSGSLNWPLANLTIGSGITGLTLGKAGNMADIIINSPQTIAGPISIYGGALTINEALTATNNNINLHASGAVTQSAALSANGLGLHGTGNFTLTNAANNIGTLAGGSSETPLGSLSFVNAGALEIGAINPVGLKATGNIFVVTKNGNLTISENVVTESKSETAIVLAAGTDASAGGDGTPGMGNVLIDLDGVGDPTIEITAGTGGTIRLYTGDVDGSTGLSQLVGLGSGNFRYNTSINADGTLSKGYTAEAELDSDVVNALYREQPTANVTVSNQTITYGDSLTVTGDATGMVNGDTPTYGVSGVTAQDFSTSNNLKVNQNGGYTLTATGLEALGYNISGGSNGTLIVNPKEITISGIKAENKTYDGNTTATVLTGNVQKDGLIVGDLVTLNSSGVFADKNAADDVEVILSNSFDGADRDNYTIVNQETTTANIIPKLLTLSALKTYDGTTDLTGFVTLGGFVGDETLGYSGAAASDKHVATAGKFINAITLENGDNGGISSNYALPTLNAANAPVTINPATLTATLSNTGVTKVYDGTTNAPGDFEPTWTFSGLVNGDTAAELNFNEAAYQDKNVSFDNNQLTLSDLAIDGVIGTNSSQATDYVLDATSKSVNASITPAPLRVRANNDARFVGQTEDTNYAGVSFIGLVNGETSDVLNVSGLSISRSDSANNDAGTYSLTLSGVTADNGNYSITFESGTYTIVPAGQLLIRVSNVSEVYGNSPTFTIASAEYLDNDNSTINSVTVTGSSSSFDTDGVTFDIEASDATTSTAGEINVGSYQLSGTVTGGNSSNFSNNLVVVGVLDITPRSLSASATGGISKIYEGTTSMSGVTLALDGLVDNDAVTVSGLGAFDSRDVGTGLDYTINNLALSGADAGNYFLSGGGSFTGGNGKITPKEVTLNPQAATRVYDGSVDYTPTPDDLAFLSDLLGVAGDTVTSATLAFDNKNVGTSKTLTLSGVVIGDGNSGNNYTINVGSNDASAITRLDSVNWVGGDTGNWFDPANWAGGAVPDLANVANVIIPEGVTVSFDTSDAISPADASQAVEIESIGSAGSLTQANGELNIGDGGMTLNAFTQNGGILTNAGPTNLSSFEQTDGSFTGTGDFTSKAFSQTGGNTDLTNNFTVSESFSQGEVGSVTVGGNTSITDIDGGMTIGNLNTTGTTNLTSTDGAITQASGTKIISNDEATIRARDNESPANFFDVILDEEDNEFSEKVTVEGDNVTLVAAGNLDADVTATTDAKVDASGELTIEVEAGGDAELTSGGDMTVSGNSQNLTTQTTGAGNSISFGNTTVRANLETTTNDGNITQTGPLDVTGTTDLAAGSGDITLDNADNNFGGVVNVLSGKDVTLNDTNSLTLGNVTTTGQLDATAKDDLTLTGVMAVDSLKLEATDGKIDQTDGTLTVDKATELTAAQNIDLAQANDFKGKVKVTDALNVTLNDINGLELGDVTSRGKLDATAGKELALNGAINVESLDLEAEAGDITQDEDSTLTVTQGPTNLEAGNDITLDGNSNAFTGKVTADGDNVNLAAAGNLDADVTAKTDVTLNASGNLTAEVEAGGDANLSSGGTMTVALDVDGNSDLSSGGNMSVEGSSTDLNITSGGSTTFGETTLAGNLDVTSAQGISQTGTLDITGTTGLAAGSGDIALTNANNTFNSPVNAASNNIGLTAKTNLALNNITARGDLNARSVEGELTRNRDANFAVGGRQSLFARGGVVSFDPAPIVPMTDVNAAPIVPVTDVNAAVAGMTSGNELLLPTLVSADAGSDSGGSSEGGAGSTNVGSATSSSQFGARRNDFSIELNEVDVVVQSSLQASDMGAAPATAKLRVGNQTLELGVSSTSQTSVVRTSQASSDVSSVRTLSVTQVNGAGASRTEVSVAQSGGVLSVNQGQTAVSESVEPVALNALNVVDRVEAQVELGVDALVDLVVEITDDNQLILNLTDEQLARYPMPQLVSLGLMAASYSFGITVEAVSNIVIRTIN